MTESTDGFCDTVLGKEMQSASAACSAAELEPHLVAMTEVLHGVFLTV